MLDSLDLLYIVVAIGIALLSIFLSIMAVYGIFILRDINKATEAIKDSAERVNALILKPIRMTHEILKYAQPIVDVVEQKVKEGVENKMKKNSKGSSKSKKKSDS